MRGLLAMLLILGCPLAFAGTPVRFDEIQIPWKPGPPTLPLGSEVAVLEGDPKAPALFTMRVKLPAGARLAPHWHPRPERVTVLSGAIGIGFGDIYEPAKLRSFGPGSYYVTPPETVHFAYCLDETVVQITTEGPWELHPVLPGAKP